MTDIERLFHNLKTLIEAGVLDDEFSVFIQDNPEMDSISELNEIIEEELSCWEEG